MLADLFDVIPLDECEIMFSLVEDRVSVLKSVSTCIFSLPIVRGSHKLWKSWKTWKITKKSSMHGKIMEFEKTLNNHGKIMEFCEII